MAFRVVVKAGGVWPPSPRGDLARSAFRPSVLDIFQRIPVAARIARKFSDLSQHRDLEMPVIKLSLVACSVKLTNESGSALTFPKSTIVTYLVAGSMRKLDGWMSP